MDKSDAHAMLASTQQLRTHWSGVITNHLSVSLTINVAIWSYFITAYIDSSKDNSADHIFILVASALSSILLGLWRLYTRHIDDHLANLYPDFLLWEGVIGIPFERGTGGYLVKAVENAKPLLTSKNMTVEDRVKGIEKLIAAKRIGDRGHKRIDLFSLTAIIAISILSFFIILSSGEKSYWFFLIANLLGIIFLIISLTCFQRNPKVCFVQSIMCQIKNETDEKT